MFSIFRKKRLTEAEINELVNSELVKMQSLSDEQLLVNLEQSLSDYKAEVERLRLDQANFEFDEVTQIGAIRQEIYEQIKTLLERKISIDTQAIQNLDKKWQDWCVKYIPQNDQTSEIAHEAPKSEWWWWIDSLDELSKEERSTL